MSNKRGTFIAEIDARVDDLIKFYLQSFISNLINVCVKHIPMSQKDGQSLNVIFINQIQEFLSHYFQNFEIFFFFSMMVPQSLL